MEARETQQLILEHVRQLAAEVAALKLDGAAPLTDGFAHWLAAHLLVAAKKAAKESKNGCLDLKSLRSLNADVVALRRGDHSAERLKLERKWLELERQNSAATMEKRFIEWAQDPENAGKMNPSKLTQEERAERIREIFGMSRLAESPPNPPSPASTQSGSIRPNPAESDS